ncbi:MULTISPECIES: acyl-CoA thioesterase [Clostridium]|uniref:4-hydroxybenzoyl-CoA thioesterase n=2 Tax=Clostridium TaxID=1485 RepID=A0A1S9N0Y8_CLOBE|nr:thioesterase family protein [Clostridium beijerinckii]MZK51471.1 YbgC/FadM family acyl-CoA thioesterase [Clostridium beijerinckii]MZK59746.1 YbgC/FadM family acyl-CoA thioesterase [Clostridium beijerinckii]MZK69963.1 YbgC/FadM family acyl-CoA thioesterase [Clostridium beijerinckii]MZK75265.1 YbgC/FadM family acyl-CoA thioesterase [Clostridium beijerinckii]MZK84881.1 YbgC/FadM family acyl-CoA thioesterase [Clostridium beijerinckii]
MYISETRIVVRYAETDKMGIVHHSNYFIWFEAGRTDFIKGSNISYSEMEENGILIPLAESNCKYIIGAKYEDELIIKTWVKQLTPVKVEFNYSVIRENDQKEIAKGSTLHVFVNNDFKIINLKKVNKEIFNKLESLI